MMYCVKHFDILQDYKPLVETGLSKLEAQVYLSALDLGSGTISDIARNAEVERTGVYYHIERLMNLGLLQSVSNKKRIVYIPADPKILKEMLNKKSQQLQNIYPKVDHQYSIATSRSISEYYRGYNEVGKFYNRLYELLAELSPPNNQIFVLGTSFRNVISQHPVFSQFTRPEKQINVLSKCILPKSQGSKKPEENLDDPYIVRRYNMPPAEIKYIADKYAYPAAVVIINDIICLIDYRNFVYSIIENSNVATTWKMFFDFIWDNLPSK